MNGIQNDPEFILSKTNPKSKPAGIRALTGKTISKDIREGESDMFRRIQTLCLLVFLLLSGANGLATPSFAEAVPAALTAARLEAWKAIQSGRAGSLTIAIMDNDRFV